ncbi:molecular chaperone DnaJ [Myxococcus fulvus 124B02]|nr:molecular chaperone DnaJ [Myxococcus fulvus 124B02]
MSTVQFVLFYSDKRVREQLFAHVDGTRGVLLVTGVRHGAAMRSPELREPFATLEFLHGRVLTQVLVADEGTPDGMWRDPLGDLGDKLHPDSKDDAYAVTTGYLLLVDGQPRQVVRKHGLPAEDLWFLEDALSRLEPRIPAPDPARRPGKKRPEPAPRAPRRPASTGAPREASDEDASGHRARGEWGDDERDGAESTGRRARGAWGGEARDGGERGARSRQDPEATPPRGTRVRSGAPARKDAWEVLGLERGVSRDEARKAFRALIAGYHPDKVAHLAPEFRELAERRTRELLEAWETVEQELES